MKATTLLTVPLLALAGCDRAAPDPAPGGAEPQDGIAQPAPQASVPPLRSPVSATIPAALQGRWGMVPADCEPGRPDAKGLLVIDDRTLEFYESVGTVDNVEEASGARIRASFDFTGEGMEWERDVTLEVQDGGTTLVRHEDGADEVTGPFRYAKCS